MHLIKKKKIYSRLTLLKLLGLILISNISACKWNKNNDNDNDNVKVNVNGSEKEENSSLVMIPVVRELTNDNKTAALTLSLSDINKTAILKDFTLEICILEEENGKGSQLNYSIHKDGKFTTKSVSKNGPPVRESLSHLRELQKLEPNHEPIQLTFTFIPGINVSKLVVGFQLFDANGQQIDDCTVRWIKKEEQLIELGDIKYDKNTQQITYKITYLGSSIPNNLKLEYISRTAKIKLDGTELLIDQPKIKDLASISITPGSSIEHQILGKLDFNGNKNANFEFKLIYEGGATTVQHHTFNTENIDLNIDKLSYDPISRTITYNIKNKGTSNAQQVSLRYSNISDEKNLEEKNVLLENTMATTINLGEIAAGKATGDRQLAINFKYADKATFKFELLYNESIITHATKTETFEAKTIKLKLIPITPLTLIGSQQEIKCKIELEADSRPLDNIDTSQLILAITDELKDKAYVSQTLGGAPMDSLAGDKLDPIGNEIVLYINENGAKEGQFSLHVEYKGKSVTINPIRIDWKKAILAIEEANNFVDFDIATFKLKNLNSVESIDAKSISIALVSSNEAKFVLLKSDNSETGTSANLALLTGANLFLSNTLTNPIQFKLANANGYREATITIIVKQGSTELARQDLLWQGQQPKIKATIILPPDGATGAPREENIFQNKEKININLENIGNLVNTTELKIQFTNTKQIAFKLGNLIGEQINSSLKEVISKNKLENNEIAVFDLELEDNPNHVICAELTLNILYNNNLLYTAHLTWINSHILNQKLNIAAIQNAYNEIEEEFELVKENNTAFKEFAPTTWYQYIQRLVTAHNKLQASITYTNNTIKSLLQTNDLIPAVATRIQNRIISNVNELDTQITSYILSSLDYAKQQVEKFSKAIQLNNQDKASKESMNLWIGTLIELIRKIDIKEAKKILEETIKISVSVEKIVTTPKKQQKVLNRVSQEAAKSPITVKKKARRKLFSDAPNPFGV